MSLQNVTNSGSREVSGQAGSISGWTAFLFGLHCISLSSSGVIPFSWVASVWPGASIPGVLTIALVFCGIHGLVFAAIGLAKPADSEAADLALSASVISPRLAFAASWTLVLFSGIVAGGLAAWVPKTALPSLLIPMSLIMHDPKYAQLAQLISGPLGTLAFGGLIIVAAAITTVHRRLSLLRSMLNAGLVFGLVAWAIIFYSLASSHGQSSFSNAWNHFMMQSGKYGCFDCRIPLAKAAGMAVEHSLWSTTMAGLIMGFWIYYGYYIPTFFAEEVRNAKRSLILASAGSLIFAYVIFMTAALMLQHLVPSQWIAAEGYLYNNPSVVTKAAGGTAVLAMPWITFYAAILQPKLWLLFAVAFGWIFTTINLVQTYLFYTGRILWSWSLNSYVPDWLAGGSRTAPNPARAILAITILAFLGLIDSAYNGPLGTQLTFAFFAVVTQLLPVLALTILPKADRKLFEQLPSGLKRKTFGMPLSSVLGGITLIYLVWMIVASFLYPAAGIASPLRTIGLLAAFIATGLLAFTTMRRYRLSKSGIDINSAFVARPLAKKPEPNFD